MVHLSIDELSRATIHYVRALCVFLLFAERVGFKMGVQRFGLNRLPSVPWWGVCVLSCNDPLPAGLKVVMSLYCS